MGVMGIGIEMAGGTASAGTETVGVRTVGARAEAAGIGTRSSRRLGVQLDCRRR